MRGEVLRGMLHLHVLAQHNLVETAERSEASLLRENLLGKGYPLRDKFAIVHLIIIIKKKERKKAIYNFPFLHASCGVVVDDNCVEPLYKHLVNIQHPSMCFVGVPYYVCAFSMFDLQVRYYVRSMNGTFKLPSREVMTRHWEQEKLDRLARGLRWDSSSASNFTGFLTLHAETQQRKHCCFTAGLESKLVVAIRADLAQGDIMHSHDYRVPDIFTNKRVLVVGAGPSGMDIALEVTTVASRVILSHHLKEQPKTVFLTTWCREARCGAAGGNQAVFLDGSEEEVDVVFLCTG
ncbi:hypothetical protein MSG28_004362 [Choristoneura fumiferana]|uniref:Uncharacterized protein n=1 Tax=Choristoneura fumiferana TaxID=7141 RepID=A0ACC0KJA8_CHOFU|nr:hypothetical protein MSG28_004362 [Choristoneura fumiferana]